MKLIFTTGYNSSDDEITKFKGHRSDIILIDNDGCHYELHFVTLERLALDLKYSVDNGKKYFTHVCLIILEEVTKDEILNCVKDLAAINYFKRFTPIEKSDPQKEWTEFSLL